MSTITHIVLAKVVNKGVARIVYSHPSIQKKSVIFSNPKMITQPVGKFVRITVKRMPSEKRILLSCSEIPKDVKSVEKFLDLGSNRDFILKICKLELLEGGPKVDTLDGKQDENFHIMKSFPRFTLIDEEAPAVEKNLEPEYEEKDSNTELSRFGNLFVPPHIIRALEAAKQVAENGQINILLIGPSGNGKTSLAKTFADEHKMNFLKVNCSTVRDAEEWFGYREARDGSTLFIETQFTEMVKAGNCVILLDEINRLEPYLHNSLMPLLDETRSTNIHGVQIDCGPNVVFISSMNLGLGFVGTFILDKAIRNRMDVTLSMPPLSKEAEVALLMEREKTDKITAITIVEKLEKLRNAVIKNQLDIDISPRTSLKIARLMSTSKFEDLNEVLAVTIFNNAENAEQAKILIDSLI